MSNLKPRICSSFVKKVFRTTPGLVILGPRQAGKSKLSRLAFGDFTHFDLEDPKDFFQLEADPLLALKGSKKVVIDEAQRLPALFPFLRNYLDNNPGQRIVLLGSASPGLVKGITESLTGRVAFFELGGLSIFEENLERLLFSGAFPRIYWGSPRAKYPDWFYSYIKSYLEQDIPQLGFRVSSVKLRRLLQMLSHVHGAILNLSEIGASLGFDYHQVSHAIDIFEGTFIVRRLQPYFRNIGKRLIKAPKVYIRDTGLLHALLEIPSFAKFKSHPKAGASFEGFCIEQIINYARLFDPAAEVFYYRTASGVEVDLILKFKSKLVPVEIKLSTKPQSFSNLKIAMNDLELKKGYQIGFTESSIRLSNDVQFLGLKEFLLGVIGKI